MGISVYRLDRYESGTIISSFGEVRKQLLVHYLCFVPQIAFSSIMFSIRTMQPLKLALGLHFNDTFDAFMKTGENIATRTRRGVLNHFPHWNIMEIGVKMSDKADDGLFVSKCLILSSMTIFMLIICVFRIHQRDKDA